jgi:hypothetical protein
MQPEGPRGEGESGVRTRDVRGATQLAAPEQSFDTYLTRLLKLIPSEVIALYLVGRGIIPEGNRLALTIWTGTALLLVVLVRTLGTSRNGKGQNPQWSSVCVSGCSFLIWIYSMGDVFQLYSVYIPYIGSLLVLTWTFVVPFFLRGSYD